MLELDADKPQSREVWRGHISSEINTDGLHSLISTPAIADGHIYGICSLGQFRCLNAATGERVWETLDVTKEKGALGDGLHRAERRTLFHQ